MDGPLDFSGRAVVVTGGTKGIGRVIAETFLAAGVNVVVCGRAEAEQLPAADGREAAFVPADVRDAVQAAALVRAAAERFGRLDVLVNNAGGSPDAPAATASTRLVDKVVALNLLAPFYVAQAANAVMQPQETGGAVVNIGSVAAPPAAGYRGVLGGEGGAARTDPGTGRRVGAQGPGQPHHHGPDPHRGRRVGLRRRRRRRGRRRHPDAAHGGTGRSRPDLPLPGE